MQLFCYTVLFLPKNTDVKVKEEKAEIVVQPTWILAKDMEAVKLMAAKKIPDRFDDRLDEVQIGVRPF